MTASASLTFVCVLRSGGVYSPQWVDRLCVQAITHLQPDRVVCLTDFAPWRGPSEIVPLVHPWPGWFSKLELFRPNLFSGPVFYCDLDSLILRPIDLRPLWPHLERAPWKLALLSDFFTPRIPASGVMAWLPSSSTNMVYRQFVSEPMISSRWDRGDGYHIGQHPHFRLQTMLPGAFGSYKADKLQTGPKDFPHVSFHGTPKQHDLPGTSWVRQTWERCQTTDP